LVESFSGSVRAPKSSLIIEKFFIDRFAIWRHASDFSLRFSHKRHPGSDAKFSTWTGGQISVVPPRSFFFLPRKSFFHVEVILNKKVRGICCFFNAPESAFANVRSTIGLPPRASGRCRCSNPTRCNSDFCIPPLLFFLFSCLRHPLKNVTCPGNPGPNLDGIVLTAGGSLISSRIGPGKPFSESHFSSCVSEP